MKRFAVVVMAVGLVVALSLAHSALAKGPKGPPGKVLIAHLCDTVVEVDDETGVTTTTEYFKVIQVSQRAADAHLAHGDLEDDGTFVKGATFTVVTTEPEPEPEPEPDPAPPDS